MATRYLQSIGMSCQTRHQIDRFAISPSGRAAGIEARTGPFDWLITPPLRMARFLDAGLPCYRPGSVIERGGRAFWTTPGFPAFHAFRVKNEHEDRLDIEATFDVMCEKFMAQREKFLNTDVTRTSFVLGNTQNNLAGEVYGEQDSHEYRFDSGKIDALEASLNRLFQAQCKLIVVSRKDRFDGDAAGDPRVRIIEKDDSEWKGDAAVWQDALSALFGLSAKPVFATCP